jgi:secreted Zn-dependent insulinase-like peptidase
MQRKQNALTVRALKVKAEESRPPSRVIFEKKMREQVERINDNESTYITSLVTQTQKSQKRIQDCLLADLTKQ